MEAIDIGKYVCLFLLSLVCKLVITSQGTWRQLLEIKDPDLKKLANRLPNTLSHSRADSTMKRYFGGFRRWVAPIIAKDHHTYNT